MPLLGYSINYKKLSPYIVVQVTQLSAYFTNTQVDSKHWYPNPENQENHIFLFKLKPYFKKAYNLQGNINRGNTDTL